MAGFKPIVTAAALAVMLSGCSALVGGGKSPATYDLSAPTSFGQIGSTRAQILVPPPSAVASLETANIVVRPSPTVISYLGDAQWSDKLPRLVQARLVEAFDASGRVRRVGKTGEGLVADYQILVDIRAFHANPTAKLAEAEIGVRIVNDGNGRIIAAETFTSQSPLLGSSTSGIVESLDSAMSSALSDIVRWTVSKI